MKKKIIGICAICCAVAGTIAATCIILSKSKLIKCLEDSCEFDCDGVCSGLCDCFDED